MEYRISLCGAGPSQKKKTSSEMAEGHRRVKWKERGWTITSSRLWRRRQNFSTHLGREAPERSIGGCPAGSGYRWRWSGRSGWSLVRSWSARCCPASFPSDCVPNHSWEGLGYCSTPLSQTQTKTHPVKLSTNPFMRMSCILLQLLILFTGNGKY